MALPEDMQVVPVILFKKDVRKAEQLARARRESRSEYLRKLITSHPDFFVAAGSLDETDESSTNHTAAA